MILPAVLLSVAPGCIVAEAPEYGSPKQTPPHIESSSISPSPYEIIDVFENDPAQTFAFKVYSEDAGDKLLTAFYYDYRLEDGLRPIDDRTWSPSTLDVPHNISVQLQLTPPAVPAGCHQLTLLVMHLSTWNDATDSPDPVKALTDMTSVTWWMNVTPNPDDPETLDDCPRSEQPAGSQ